MAVIKCKMCGGDLTIAENVSVAECEYCGTKQTVPVVDDEKKITLFSRANRLRLACEFDKAAGIYESIVTEFPEEAEAYWGLVLCKYGIEYVDDPKTGKKIPTCHRSSFDSVMEDSDFEMVLEYADVVARGVYREEAKAIERIRQGILEVSAKEAPYDIFICYKETDFNGERTLDSVLAQDIYDALTEKGYRTFFARITLEDKLGQMYEPYIFAALNSAKVMLAIGTDYEYYNAVWVKNEWSRFLSLIEKGEKKTLIPCYKGLDAYDMPKEFKRLQAQDLGKVGAIQDLLRGIQKILVPADKTETIKETVIVNEKAASTEPLLKRAFMFLEDGDWEIADEYCERALDIDPENAEAYVGKLLAGLKVSNKEGLKKQVLPFENNGNYQKAVRFADEKLREELTGYIEYIKVRNENARLNGIYTRATEAMSSAKTDKDYKEAAQRFETIREYKNSAQLIKECYENANECIYNLAKNTMLFAKTENDYKAAAKQLETISEYKDSVALIKECYEKAEVARKDSLLATGKAYMHSEYLFDYEAAIRNFKAIPGWKDADEQIALCQQKIEEIKVRDEETRIEREHQEEFIRLEKERIARRKRRVIIATGTLVCVFIAFLIINARVIEPNKKYNEAIALMDAENIVEAYEILISMNGYKDSVEKAKSIYEKYKIEKWKTAEVGDYVVFGTYEQDNNKSNGKEDIEWLVLDIKDGKVLVISKYILECKSYNTIGADVTWETCTIRKWMNDEFMNSAFNDDEKTMISTVTVSADKNPSYTTSPGRETWDQMFLLSIDEVHKYFGSNSEKKSAVSIYADVTGAGGIYDSWQWWLRSPGSSQKNASYVYKDGSVDMIGDTVTSTAYGIRPAMWIDLNN